MSINLKQSLFVFGSFQNSPRPQPGLWNLQSDVGKGQASGSSTSLLHLAHTDFYPDRHAAHLQLALSCRAQRHRPHPGGDCARRANIVSRTRRPSCITIEALHPHEHGVAQLGRPPGWSTARCQASRFVWPGAHGHLRHPTLCCCCFECLTCLHTTHTVHHRPLISVRHCACVIDSGRCNQAGGSWHHHCW